MDSEREKEQSEIDALKVSAGKQRLEFERNELLTNVKQRIIEAANTQKEATQWRSNKGVTRWRGVTQ
jgi:hypothetical protein